MSQNHYNYHLVIYFQIDYDTLRSWFSDIYYARSTDVKVYEIVYARDGSSHSQVEYEEWLEFEGVSSIKFNNLLL